VHFWVWLAKYACLNIMYGDIVPADEAHLALSAERNLRIQKHAKASTKVQYSPRYMY
jgi:hypothetical protein